MDWEAWVDRLEGVTLPPVAAHPLPHGWSPRLSGGWLSIGPVEVKDVAWPPPAGQALKAGTRWTRLGSGRVWWTD